MSVLFIKVMARAGRQTDTLTNYGYHSVCAASALRQAEAQARLPDSVVGQVVIGCSGADYYRLYIVAQPQGH